MANNILLTGATGFIGSHVLQGLLQGEYNVTILIRPTSDTWRISPFTGKVNTIMIPAEPKEYESIMERLNIDTIIHTATDYGRNSLVSDILLSNVLFPLHLIEAGLKKGLKRFINTDSFFGKNAQPASYLGQYVHSKKILLTILKEESPFLRIDNLRLEHPFGENDSDGKFVTMLINEMKQQKEKILLTEGCQRRDFIYVKDVANAFMKVLEQDDVIGFNEYEVGTGQSIPVKEFVQTLATVMQSHSELAFGALPSRDNELQDSKANTTLLNNMGWYPAFDLKTALQQTVANNKEILK